MLRILQIGKYYAPVHGGVESVVRNLSEGLVERGHQVSVLCSNDENSIKRTRINGVEVIRCARFGVFQSQPINLSMLSTFFKIAKNYDLVHCHSPNFFAEACALYALNKSIPVVCSLHADINPQKWLARPYGVFLKWFLQRTKANVVSSLPYLESSRLLEDLQNETKIVEFGVPTPATVEVQSLPSFGLFVGRLVAYKGVDILLQAAKQVRVPLKIVGDGPELRRLKRLAIDLSVQDRIEFLGDVSNDQLDLLYRKCKFVVLPSIHQSETFGISLIEGMAHGKPVISTNVGTGTDSVNQHGMSGLVVPPRDPKALATAIEALTTDSQLYDNLARYAHAHFLLNYGVEKMVMRYESLYLDCLAHSQTLSPKKSSETQSRNLPQTISH